MKKKKKTDWRLISSDGNLLNILTSINEILFVNFKYVLFMVLVLIRLKVMVPYMDKSSNVKFKKNLFSDFLFQYLKMTLYGTLTQLWIWTILLFLHFQLKKKKKNVVSVCSEDPKFCIKLFLKGGFSVPKCI